MFYKCEFEHVRVSILLFVFKLKTQQRQIRETLQWPEVADKAEAAKCVTERLYCEATQSSSDHLHLRLQLSAHTRGNKPTLQQHGEDRLQLGPGAEGAG